MVSMPEDPVDAVVHAFLNDKSWDDVGHDMRI